MILFCSPLKFLSQSISKERIRKLKRCVVKVFIENGESVGTGFFISSYGDILTCWHVIKPAIKTDSLGHILGIKNIYITLTNRDTIEVKIPLQYFTNAAKNKNAVSYDYCILTPSKKIKDKTDFFKLGSFEDIDEGDEIYTAGYPLGIDNQFLSKGVLSTKYIDSSIFVNGNIKVRRTVALLDLTMNRGNSGGPIIKIGKNIDEDKVIGIADFLLTKNGTNAESLIKELNDRRMNISIDDGKGNLLCLTDVFKMFAEAIAYSSIGISGCISINHFLQSSE